MKRTASLANLGDYRPTKRARYNRTIYRKPTITEYKYATQTKALTEVTSTAAFTLLNGLALGNDYNNRVGRKVNWWSLQLKMLIKGDTGGVPENLRMLVVKDKQPNGAEFGITDLLDAATMYSQKNLNNRSRFTILADRVYNIDGVTKLECSDKAFFRFKGKTQTTYNSGATAVIGSIETNSLYLVLVSDVAANGPDVAFTARFKYVD